MDLVNQTKFVDETATVPCYEILFGGAIPDFVWLKWKRNINDSVLDFFIKNRDVVDEYLEVIRPDLYKQVSRYQSRTSLKSKFGVELVLQNLTINDSGWYTCLVSNHIGSDFSSMYLNVIENKVNKNF